MNQLFRVISYLEGISYLLLLFIGVPMKYMAGNDLMVKMMGMPHGLLFIAYILLAFYLKPSYNWSFKDFAIVLLGSILPFGTFYVDKKYLKREYQTK